MPFSIFISTAPPQLVSKRVGGVLQVYFALFYAASNMPIKLYTTPPQAVSLSESHLRLSTKQGISKVFSPSILVKIFVS